MLPGMGSKLQQFKDQWVSGVDAIALGGRRWDIEIQGVECPLWVKSGYFPLANIGLWANSTAVQVHQDNQTCGGAR
jgi:hypothetical protein